MFDISNNIQFAPSLSMVVPTLAPGFSFSVPMNTPNTLSDKIALATATVSRYSTSNEVKEKKLTKLNIKPN